MKLVEKIEFDPSQMDPEVEQKKIIDIVAPKERAHSFKLVFDELFFFIRYQNSIEQWEKL